MARAIKAPADLGGRGRALWVSCLRCDDTLADSDNPQRLVLLDACRTADQIDALQAIIDAEGSMRGEKIHPAVAEITKHRSLMARLIASLRLPDAETSRRPQRRMTAHVQAASKPGGRSNVSALDRARRGGVA